MGLDIGIINIQYLDRPSGHAYRFMWDLAVEASAWGYMHGEGNNWGYFEKCQVARLLLDFSLSNALTRLERREVWAWVQSLPWEDNEIELHFNW